jgi:hypothetical protein
MSAVTLRVDKATIKQYLRKVEDQTVQKYGLLKFLQKKGRITFNNSGTDKEWPVKKRRNTPVGMGDAETMQFNRVNRHDRATISWRSQSMNESISKMEKLQNRGKEALFKLVDKKVDTLQDDFLCDLDKQLYIDGSVTGNEQKLEGALTVVNQGTTAQYPVPTSSDTYAGLVMAPGYYGGSLDSGASWPFGPMDPEYYFWTPWQVDYDHASFGGTSWEDNCVEALRLTIAGVAGTRGDEGLPDALWMTPLMHAQFKARQETKERIVVERGDQAGMVALGFKGAINFDGVDCLPDFHVPASHVFGFKAAAIELASMQDQLLVPTEDSTLEDRTDRISIDFYGNMKWNPRAMTYLGAF